MCDYQWCGRFEDVRKGAILFSRDHGDVYEMQLEPPADAAWTPGDGKYGLGPAEPREQGHTRGPLAGAAGGGGRRNRLFQSARAKEAAARRKRVRREEEDENAEEANAEEAAGEDEKRKRLRPAAQPAALRAAAPPAAPRAAAAPALPRPVSEDQQKAWDRGAFNLYKRGFKKIAAAERKEHVRQKLAAAEAEGRVHLAALLTELLGKM